MSSDDQENANPNQGPINIDIREMPPNEEMYFEEEWESEFTLEGRKRIRENFRK